MASTHLKSCHLKYLKFSETLMTKSHLTQNDQDEMLLNDQRIIDHA